MNKFAWNITFKKGVDLESINYESISTYMENWDINIYVFWETESKTSEEIIEEFKSFWEVINYDISIETEDKIFILNNKIDWDIYELVCFEWVEICIEEVLERFAESAEIVSIREAEDSSKFNNRVIKADFVY
jgi:hypothetical protein